MTKVFLFSALVFTGGLIGKVKADIIPWNITVEIDSIVNGSTDPVYSFGALPEAFQGTFTADNAVFGPISNLSLSVGGVDLATAYPFFGAANGFDPVSATLSVTLVKNEPPAAGPSFQFVQNPTTVVIGDSGLGIVNFRGTYTVSPIPEPGGLLCMGLLSLVIFRSFRRRS